MRVLRLTTTSALVILTLQGARVWVYSSKNPQAQWLGAGSYPWSMPQACHWP